MCGVVFGGHAGVWVWHSARLYTRFIIPEVDHRSHHYWFTFLPPCAPMWHKYAHYLVGWPVSAQLERCKLDDDLPTHAHPPSSTQVIRQEIVFIAGGAEDSSVLSGLVDAIK